MPATRSLAGTFALAFLLGCAEDQPPPQPSGFCYLTLAEVTCYTEPDAGREGRLTGELPPVVDTP